MVIAKALSPASRGRLALLARYTTNLSVTYPYTTVNRFEPPIYNPKLFLRTIILVWCIHLSKLPTATIPWNPKGVGIDITGVLANAISNAMTDYLDTYGASKLRKNDYNRKIIVLRRYIFVDLANCFFRRYEILSPFSRQFPQRLRC